MKKIIITLLLFFAPVLKGMEDSNKLVVFAIPGINGPNEYWEYYVKNILKVSESWPIFKQVEVPRNFFIDLGQDNCISNLQDAVCEYRKSKFMNKKPEKVVAHARSQGAGTLLNYLGLVYADKKAIFSPDAIILEGAMVSANSAIERRATFGFRIPVVHYLLPYLAQFRFPYYSPSGPQAIKSIENLSKNTDKKVPVIIIHDKKDPVIPFSDSCALYYALVKKGHDVYFIQTEYGEHINLIESENDKSIIKAILETHDIIKGKDGKNINLSQYQPNCDQYKEDYENMIKKEMYHEQIVAPFMRIIRPISALLLAYYVMQRLYCWATRLAIGAR